MLLGETHRRRPRRPAEPRLAAWLGEEMRRASEGATRLGSGVARHGVSEDGFASAPRRAIVPAGRTPDVHDRPPGRHARPAAGDGRRAGAEQGAVGARARGAGEDVAAVVQRRQRHRQLHRLAREAVQAVPPGVPARAAAGGLQGVQGEEHRHRARGGAQADLRAGAVDRFRGQAAGEGLLSDRADKGQLQPGLHPVGRRMEADPPQRQAGHAP